MLRSGPKGGCPQSIRRDGPKGSRDGWDRMRREARPCGKVYQIWACLSQVNTPLPDVLAASLHPLRQVLLRGHLRHRSAERAVHDEGDRDGRASCRRGRPAVPLGLVAHVAGPPRLGPVRDDPELGRGVGRRSGAGGGSAGADAPGGKTRKPSLRVTVTSTRRSKASRARPPQTNSTTARFAFCS